MLLPVIVASVLAALVPTALYTLLVWWADRHEREPLPLLLAVFFWGAVPATAVALALEGPSQTIPQVYEGITRGAILSSALGVPIIEEVVKALALLAVVTLASREFDGVLDGIVYGAVVGFGFAMTENIFYFIGAYGEQGWSWWAAVVGLRAVIFGFNHAVFTACTGIGFGLAVLSRRRAWRWLFPLWDWPRPSSSWTPQPGRRAFGSVYRAVFDRNVGRLGWFLAAGADCRLNLGSGTPLDSRRIGR